VADAVALERAGCVMLLIEAVPPELTQRVVEATTVPVIGIGAGPAPHGQVLVIQDLLGMTESPPRFAEPVAQLGVQIQTAGAEWVRRVSERRIGVVTPGNSAGIRTGGAGEHTGTGAPASAKDHASPIQGKQ
jgi:ketopantoate hydroxymethyltransferase